MKRFRGLTSKITLTFVFFAAVLLCFMGFLVFATGRDALEAAITADLVSTALEKEAAFNRWVDGALLDVTILARSSPVRDNTQILTSSQDDAEVQIAHDRLTAELHSSVTENTPFLDFLVLHPESGQVIAATNYLEEGRFKENRPYFIQGRTAPYVQNVYYSLQRQEPAMTVSTPIYGTDGDLTGVLVGRLNLTALNDIMSGYTDLYETYDAHLVNTSNLFVTQPRFIADPAVLRRGIHTDIVETCLAGSSGSILADDYRDVSAVAAYRWIEARQLCLVVKVDEAEAFADIEDGFGGSLLVIGIGLLVVSSGLAVGFARTLTRPILVLKEGVTRFGQGEFDVRLSETSQDELGQLAHEFNTMANLIAEKNSLLQDYTKELETHVEERKRSEARFRGLLESAPDAMVIVNSEGTIVLVNAQTQHLFGYTAEELLGQTVEILIPEGLRGRHPEHRTGYFTNPHTRSMGAGMELFALRKDGSEFPVEVSLSPLETDEGLLVSSAIRDITRRKRAEEALLQSEQWASAIVESAYEAFIAIDSEGIIIDWNTQAENIFGWKRTEILGQILAETIIPPTYQEAHRQGLQHFLATGEGAKLNKRFEISAQHRDGQEFPVELTITPILQGDSYRFTAFLHDITERKEMEALLVKSRDFYKTMLEEFPALIWQSGTDAKCNYFNQTWLAFTGRTLEQELGDGWAEGVHPEDFDRCLNIYLTAFEARQPFTMEYRLRHHRGDYRWIIDHGRPIDDIRGEFIGYIGACYDITERRRAEQEIRKLNAELEQRVEERTTKLAFLAEASAVLSASLDYQTCLEQLAQLTVPRIADWCAIDILEADGSLNRLAVVHTDPSKVALAYELQRQNPPDPDAPRGVYQVLRTGQSEFYPEIPDAMLRAAVQDEKLLKIIRSLGLKSAMTLPLIAHERTLGAITLVMAESGRHYAEDDLVLGEDLARRAALLIDNAKLYHETQELNTELEERVEQRTAQLSATNRELEAFSYSVSHDLRAPLRALDGFSQALLEDYHNLLDADGQEFLDRIRFESQRMGHLIDDLLNLSRFTRTEMQWQQVDLSTMVREIAASLQQQEPQRKVEFVIEDGLTACGDLRLLHVVVQNLIGNAWKYSGKQPMARIEFGVMLEDDERVYFVRDNGVGFDMSYVNKLFGAFQRLHANADFEGTGIGLATVQRIIHRHSGTVRAEGEPNKGAVFSFTLGQNNCE